jgi:hypothetical protein
MTPHEHDTAARVPAFQTDVSTERHSHSFKRPLLARIVDAVATTLNLLMSAGADMRNGDYHVILRKR